MRGLLQSLCFATAPFLLFRISPKKESIPQMQKRLRDVWSEWGDSFAFSPLGENRGSDGALPHRPTVHWTAGFELPAS